MHKLHVLICLQSAVESAITELITYLVSDVIVVGRELRTVFLHSYLCLTKSTLKTCSCMSSSYAALSNLV